MNQCDPRAPIDREALARALSGHPWAETVQVLDSIDSTNNYLKRLAAMGAPEGTVAIAEEQTAGRGRLGRSFSSRKGVGLYFSVLLRPQLPPERLMHLTCAVAVAVCDAIEEAAGFRPGIKWINDLVARGRKLCGILAELALTQGGQVDYAVVGIGINCAQEPEDFDPAIRDMAGSLAMIAGRPIDRTALAAACVRAMERLSADLSDSAGYLARYRADCITLGSRIQVIRGDSRRPGQALDIREDGGLVVQYTDGTIETVQSGEVSVRGLYGYTNETEEAL